MIPCQSQSQSTFGQKVVAQRCKFFRHLINEIESGFVTLQPFDLDRTAAAITIAWPEQQLTGFVEAFRPFEAETIEQGGAGISGDTKKLAGIVTVVASLLDDSLHGRLEMVVVPPLDVNALGIAHPAIGEVGNLGMNHPKVELGIQPAASLGMQPNQVRPVVFQHKRFLDGSTVIAL